MINTEPFNQRKLFGLDKYMNNLINLYKIKKLPNKILLSGQKGYMNLKTRNKVRCF